MRQLPPLLTLKPVPITEAAALAPERLDSQAPAAAAARRRLRRVLRWAVRIAIVVALLAIAFGAYLYFEARSLVGELQAGPKRAVIREARRALGTEPAHTLARAIEARAAGAAAAAAAGKAIARRGPPRGPLAAPVAGIADPRDEKAQTVLLIGSDRRWGEKQGGRSDTIMLVRLNPANRTISVLSVPRDLRVAIPGFGTDRVNAAFTYGGEKLLILTLRDAFGVRIDHVIEINFRGFQDVVNALGGVLIPVDGRYFNHNDGSAAHAFADIDLLPGYQRLNATDALAYVRYRHGDSDFVRSARQATFLREVGRQTFASRWDFLRMRSLLHAFAKATASDISSMREIWRIVSLVHDTPPDRVSREVLPGNDAIRGGAYYLESWPEQRRAAVERWFHPTWRIGTQARDTLALRRARPAVVQRVEPVIPDGGAAVRLIRPLAYPLPRCAPTVLPRGYVWAADNGARLYALRGGPAIAAWATAGSGNSMLLQQMAWTDAPILHRPGRSVRIGNRSYDLWYESGALRQIAWRMGPTVAFLENTLENKLSSRQLLAVASSCRVLRRGR